MNKLTREKRAQILHLMVEGCSIRTITRVADVSKNTVSSILIKAGRAFGEYQDMIFKKLPCKRIQVDEIWSFCYTKQKNVATAIKPPLVAGDVWTWTAICADTKIVPSWLVGNRDAECANAFIMDLASRLSSRVQLTSDGLNVYLEAVENAFGNDIDYAMLVKAYGDSSISRKDYKHDEHVAVDKRAITGKPDTRHISTSFVERQNLTMRMGMRRFTRKTNGFSKKIENHAHALSIYFMHYNFVRIHQTLKVTPAMECGIANKLFSFEDLVTILEEWEFLN